VNIAFRTDASKQIGTGHFMRCLALADELKKKGAQISFVSRHLPVHLSDLLIARGLKYKPLSADAMEEPGDELAHSHWLPTSQAQDADSTRRALGNQSWDWIVVDHYALDARWEGALRGNCKKIIVIDDLADRKHDCDVLLDQNYYEDMNFRYSSKVPAHCQLLLGPKYALLREEFGILHKHTKPRAGNVKKVLIFFGGVDALNHTSLAIQALAKLNCQQQVDVVIGANHPNCIEIQNDCAEYGYVCHVQTTHMAKLMAEADLAIGGGGIATWERCCLGLPTLTLCLAENQRKQVVDAAKKGLLYAPECYDKNLANSISHHVKSLLEAPALINLISQAGMRLVNGGGSRRVAGVMGVSHIKMRQAVEADSKNIFEWRNNPKIRKASKNSDPISWEGHRRWFDAVLTDKSFELIIGSLEEKVVGVVRFDIKDDASEVSIYLVPDGGFSGYGSSLLLSAEQWLKKNRPEIRTIKANVLGENGISQNLFLSLNYFIKTISYEKKI
jgi:UDP-2,4-diacetamido-2,4,6-trideoxy-beta-L-altropyranose hydrolase